MRLAFVCALLLLLTTRVNSTQTWTVATMYFYMPDYSISIEFTLSDDDVLTLNRTSICTPWSGSSSECYILHISGNWAVCGSVDGETGDLIPDPYATFEYGDTGTEVRGKVTWAPDTPPGYTCPLLLGHTFNGDGAASYQGWSHMGPGPVVTATLAFEWSLTFQGDSYFWPVDHTFGVTHKQPIVVDIHPDEHPNLIDLSSKGVVPVAVLSTEQFDATTLDPATMTLAGASAATKKNGTFRFAVEDVNKDGRDDLMLFFRTQDLQLDSSSTCAWMFGWTKSSIPVIGKDVLEVVQ